MSRVILTFANQSLSRTDATHVVAMSPDGQRLAIACRNSKVIVLDAAPVTADLLVECEAYRVVSGLYGELKGSRPAVLEHLQSNAILSTALRKEARARAERYIHVPELPR